MVITNALGQDFTITNFTTKNGLPSNLVYKCYQDDDGYLWVATSDGLAKFDGQKFTTYNLKDGLRNAEILHVNAIGNLIIGFHLNGCFIIKNSIVFDPKDGPLSRINATEHYYNEIIDSSLIIATLDSVYFLNKNTFQLQKVIASIKGIPLVENGSINIISTSAICKNTITDNDKYDIRRWYPAHNKPNSIFLVSNRNGSGISFDKQTKKTNLLFELHAPVTNCYVASDSILYLSSPKGLESIDLHTNKHYKLLDNITTYSVHEDRDGNIWACTPTEGLFRIRKNNSVIDRKHFDAKFPAVSTFIKAGGEIILGHNNNTYSLYNQKQIRTKYLPNGAIQNRVISIVPYHNQFCFFTDNFVANNTGTLYNQNIYCSKSISSLNKEEVLLSNCNGLMIYNLALSRGVKTLITGRSGINYYTSRKSIYAASVNNLFYKKTISAKPDTLHLNKNLNVRVNCIVEDTSNRIWIGTNGLGIYILTKNNAIEQHLSSANFLGNDNINSIVIDKKNRIWIGSNNGLIMLRETKNKRFDVTYPISGIELGNEEVNHIVVDEDSVYFTTSKEFIQFIYKEENKPLPLTLKTVYFKANDSIIQNLSIPFSPSQNNIKIKLECPSIGSTKEPIYFYALLNEHSTDTPWQKTNSSLIEFNALKAGDYNLLVRAKDGTSAKKQSNISSIKFTINEYFYKTNLFIVLLFMAILSIIILLVISINRYRQNKIKKELALESKINELRLNGMLSQMNPHFLFNILNSVQYFIAHGKTDEAADFINQFSLLMREILENSKKDLIGLESEISFLKKYLYLEQKRFGDNFNFSFTLDVGNEIEDIFIPPMLIQPLLENAIKHGITTRQDQKNLIQVKISLINSNLLQVLVINDTGKLTNYNKKEHLSTAINTIKERLQLFKINGNSGRFNLNIEEKLTTAQLVIPIQ